jgi:hypothetical protein
MTWVEQVRIQESDPKFGMNEMKALKQATHTRTYKALLHLENGRNSWAHLLGPIDRSGMELSYQIIFTTLLIIQILFHTISWHTLYYSTSTLSICENDQAPLWTHSASQYSQCWAQLYIEKQYNATLLISTGFSSESVLIHHVLRAIVI